MNGIINVYKEAGYTSFDVVAKLRGILREKKIGHTGTLDPEATGVLPVCIGNATKVCALLTDKDKVYEAVLCLGTTTDTQDATGTVLSDRNTQAACLDAQTVRDAIMDFVGCYEQIPPMYSALKVGGRKLCDLAREGVEVERKARTVQIYGIEILQIDLPCVTMRVHCSKGTYIRTLCADIGERLGVGGMMKSLIRTRVSCFSLEEAHTLAQIEEYRDCGRLDEILPRLQIAVSDEAQKRLRNGNRLEKNDLTGDHGGASSGCRVYDADGRFCGIYEWDDARSDYKCKKMFL